MSAMTKELALPNGHLYALQGNPLAESIDMLTKIWLAAGPLSEQPGTMPYRVVLIGYTDGKGYVVYNEVFDPVPYRGKFSDGEYFGKGAENLVRATQRFAARVASNAESLASLFGHPPDEG